MYYWIYENLWKRCTPLQFFDFDFFEHFFEMCLVVRLYQNRKVSWFPGLTRTATITHRIHGTGIFTYMNGWFLWEMSVNIPVPWILRVMIVWSKVKIGLQFGGFATCRAFEEIALDTPRYTPYKWMRNLNKVKGLPTISCTQTFKSLNPSLIDTSQTYINL